MNERFKELMIKAIYDVDRIYDPIDNPLNEEVSKMYIPDCFAEKFAELIVRECMSLCEDVKFQHSQYRKQETDFGMKNIYAEGEATCDLLQNKMKEHFGVEE